MNKKEVIEEIEKEKSNFNAWEHSVRNRALDDALAIVRKLDEPEKPKVPQFVADWIEWCKKNKVTLLGACTAICNNKNIRSLDASLWSMKNQETFAKAWFCGYEIKKEKLYTVEIPNPNRVGGKTVLSKNQSTGKLILEMLNSDINKPKYLHLTEAEIKQDFEWAFRWAKEVEE